jgi:hypothetical protein
MNTQTPTTDHQAPSHGADTPGVPRRVLWLAGLLVALGAAVATAHGLYEVAHATGTPSVIAALYPLITDGLAVVAYAATTRLTGRARAYAWVVVILAAGLSGLAQASYMADATPALASRGTNPAAVPGALRFGVGAWPALAAAIVAHLLFLIGTHTPQPTAEPGGAAERPPLNTEPSTKDTVQLPAVQPEPEHPPVEHPDVEQSAAGHQTPATAVNGRAPVNTTGRDTTSEDPAGSAFERAHRAAESHAQAHGHLPTVTQLMELAEVSRGTAHNALKPLRERSTALHLVRNADDHRPLP